MSTENQNSLGLGRPQYAGSPSTLCTGCGHDSISMHIISACYQSDISPTKLLKMSGIGCSSKIPAYFISSSFSFNSMHGRMAPVTTGANAVRPDMYFVGISGDGDTGSIGLGGFIHMLRRNVRCTYVVANNGVYGLTKGQFSATADQGSLSKGGAQNLFKPIDLCTLAIEAGCTFVARSFSGDAKQMVPLLKAALRHKGTAFIDVVSPCVTFNNHDGSTKSYGYVKSHDIVLQELGFIAPQEEISADYNEGEKQIITLHDGSRLVLRKLVAKSHDITDRTLALEVMRSTSETDELLTGLFYVNESVQSLDESLNLGKVPLANLTEKDLRIPEDQYREMLQEFR